MERIAIIGTSGSGKTTHAKALAAKLDLPHLELDSVFHQPGWTARPTEQFQAQVAGFCAGDRWVTCGKYASVRPLLFDRADTIVCVDHNRVRQTARVARRTVGRVITRQELWNGNHETIRNLWPFGNPERTIVKWTWTNIPRARALFDELEADPPDKQTRIVRLHGWGDVNRFLADATG